jgi:hypothetical protein
MALLFSSGRLPFRFGQLLVPEDNTMRRLDILGFTKRDTTESGKRLFNNIYNIRVSSELFPDQLVQMYQVLETPTISFETQDTPFTTITN